MVIIVGVVLAFTYGALKPFQDENIEADKQQQILAAARIVPEGKAADAFAKYITNSFAVNAEGQVVSENAKDVFDINMAQEMKKAEAERRYPVFEFTGDDGAKRYILAVSGAGLWGAIWGYVAVEEDGHTIYGAYFSHAGETPGLGAEIAKPAFQDQFQGKDLVKEGEFKPVQVMKKGQVPTDGSDYVDAISGGTITSKGVQDMLSACLSGYKGFLINVNNQPSK